MRKEKLFPKNEKVAEKLLDEKAFYDRVKQIFENKGGIYGVALRKKILGNNVYRQIRNCGKGITKIQELLSLVEHRLDWKLVNLKKEESKI